MLWKDLQVIIPAVVSIPERFNTVKGLLSQLGKQCPGVSVTIIPQDKYNPQTAFESIHKGLQGIYAPWVFYMEDDIALSSKFGEKALDLINTLKDDNIGAISFFSYDVSDIERYKNGINLYEANYPFAFAQCLAIKLEVVLAWKEMVLNWWNSSPEYNKKSPDFCIGDCCKSLNKKIMIYIPNLAQHIRTPSAFGNTMFAISSTFELSNN